MPDLDEVARAAVADVAVHGQGTAGIAWDEVRVLHGGVQPARAGVGKQTVYRWWPSKAAVVLEALGERAEAEVWAPAGECWRADLERFLARTFTAVRRQYGPMLRALMAEAQRDMRQVARDIAAGDVSPSTLRRRQARSRPRLPGPHQPHSPAPHPQDGDAR